MGSPVPHDMTEPADGDFERRVLGFTRHLAGASPKTVAVYVEAVDKLARWCYMDDDRPHQVELVTREDMELFMIDLTAGLINGRRTPPGRMPAPGTLSIHFRGLQQFFKWFDGFTTAPNYVNPMMKLRKPKVVPKPIQPLTLDELHQMLDVVDGHDFRAIRDRALLSLFIDTGCRLSELAKLCPEDVRLRAQTVTVIGKGRGDLPVQRTVHFARDAANAMDRYLEVRDREVLRRKEPGRPARAYSSILIPHADPHRREQVEALWLGDHGKGALTPSGVYQVVRGRAEEAGLKVNPHRFRHTMAHFYLANGGQETNLMAQAGWASPAMLGRYTAAQREARAINAQSDLSLLDSLNRPTKRTRKGR